MQRLDVGTSGVMVICKSEHAYSVLKNAFRHRTVDKTYHALVQGHPDPLAGTVDAPIGRHPHHDYKFAVMADGRHSVTHYETLEAHRFASLLEVHLETGRTHQIRVHMSALKHPCVGDLTYGADPTLAKRLGLERQWLHAMRLGFEHPESGDYVTYESTHPDDLAHALDVIRDEALSSLAPSRPRPTTSRPSPSSTSPPVAGPVTPSRRPCTPTTRRGRGSRAGTCRRTTSGWPSSAASRRLRALRRRPGSTTSTSTPTTRATASGTALFELVAPTRPDGFCLWVFESNAPARDVLRPARLSSSSSAPTARPTRRARRTSAWRGPAPTRWPSCAG